MALLLGGLLLGSWVYCLLAIVAGWRYKRDAAKLAAAGRAGGLQPPISVLKPLSGAEPDLEDNLRSFFQQHYQSFELLFAVRNRDDPAVAVVEALQQQFPAIPSRLLVTGEPPWANAKVFSLASMVDAASYEILAMADSDVRVDPAFLQVLAAEFADPRVGLLTCPYKAVAGPSLPSRLEAIGMNTEFLSGVLAARMLEGMHFALGPTIVIRRAALDQIGGMASLSEYLAEDFVLGQRVPEQGWLALLSSYVIEHRIGSQDWRHNAAHRLRWNRSTRRSRPAGYAGQIFTNPLPLCLLLAAVEPGCWVLSLSGTLILRALTAWWMAARILAADLTPTFWLLLPLQDSLSFVFWCAGFFGSTIRWRGRHYRLMRDGRFALVASKHK